MLSAVFLSFMRNKSKSTKNIVSIDGGYKMLSIKDDMGFDSENSEEASESEIFTQL
jgi:hypothetical protein